MKRKSLHPMPPIKKLLQQPEAEIVTQASLCRIIINYILSLPHDCKLVVQLLYIKAIALHDILSF